MFFDRTDDCRSVGATKSAVQRHHTETAMFRGFRNSFIACFTRCFTLFRKFFGNPLRSIGRIKIFHPICDFAQQRRKTDHRSDSPRAGSCNAKPATAITSVGIHSNGINAIKYGSGKWPSQPAGISPSAIHTTQIINAIQSAIIIQATPYANRSPERTYANSEPPSVASLPDSDDSAM